MPLITPIPVWVRHKWYLVPHTHTQNADGQLKNDQEFCTKLQADLKMNIFGMCTTNFTEGGKPKYEDSKAHSIFKRVYCNTSAIHLDKHPMYKRAMVHARSS